MKIAILGSRGIPNNYGGFEQFAEYLSKGLAQKGHDVYVYNSHNHSYQHKLWNNVNIIHAYDPEYKYGTFGQFIYDLNCIIDSRKRDFDIIYQLGYTSNSIWHKLLPKNALIVTNMDGLEWMRSKYSSKVRKFLKLAEKWAAESSQYLIADSLGIKKYLKEKYNKQSTYLPYGANLFQAPNVSMVKKYSLIPYEYDLLIARLEPENNVDAIISGFTSSSNERTLVVIGNTDTKYGKYITEKFPQENILFLGSIFDINILNNFRYFSNIYYHGHTVGGTNPSLLEAMASSALICAHDNIFNRAILGDDAFYFKDSSCVKKMAAVSKAIHGLDKVESNLNKIQHTYNWERIISDYDTFFNAIYEVEKVPQYVYSGKIQNTVPEVV